MQYSSSISGFCYAILDRLPSAYDEIRRMGFLSLPHPKTLQKKRTHLKAHDGSNKSLYLNIIKIPKKDTQGMVLFDEIKVLGGVGFHSKSGNMIGFVEEQDFMSHIKMKKKI